MITLHYSPGSANFAPHVLLHEIGLPFELALVDRANAAHKSAAYLKLNPNGLIPVLVDGDLVLYEAAAICLHLADSHPQAQLSPPLASLERAHFYKWLVWLTNTVQAHLIHYFYSERLVDPGNHQAAAQVKRHAQAKVAACLQQIDQHLGQTGGPWMMGGRYSALDAYTWMLCRWTRSFDPKPAREHPNIAPFMHRTAQRPALQRAVAAEGLALPLF